MDLLQPPRIIVESKMYFIYLLSSKEGRYVTNMSYSSCDRLDWRAVFISFRRVIVKSAEHCGADYKPLDR